MISQFVAQTFSNQESLAQREIIKLKFDAIHLSIARERRTKFGRRVYRESLFPGYIFVAFDLIHDNWKTILGCRGVHSILGSDAEHPKPLPPGLVDLFKSRFEAGEFGAKKPIPIKPNDSVLVNIGLPDLIPGVCTRLSKRERLRILMEYMGAEREIEVPSSMVIAAPRLSEIEVPSSMVIAAPRLSAA